MGADCDSAEPLMDTPDSAGILPEGEGGELGLSELFAGFPHPTGHLGGSTHAGLLPDSRALGPGTQSGPQPSISVFWRAV